MTPKWQAAGLSAPLTLMAMFAGCSVIPSWGRSLVKPAESFVQATARREGNELRVTLHNRGSELAAYNSFAYHWEPHIFDVFGNEISNPSAYYAQVDMRSEQDSDWRVIGPGESQSFLLSAHQWSGEMKLSLVVGSAEVTCGSGSSEVPAYIEKMKIAVMPPIRTSCRLP
jgi:hypothetical protein